jgi:DNA-binding PadR family transcriptional regulator
MTSLLKFGERDGRERSLLALFILHSLNQAPKSGYDLRKEIGEKTRGHWVPSKGTLYPVLHQLEEEDLIAVHTTGNRGKTSFALTEKGDDTLHTIKERSRELHKKMGFYKDLILDIFGGGKITMKSLLFEIKTTLDELPPGNEERAVQILEVCLTELKKVP